MQNFRFYINILAQMNEKEKEKIAFSPTKTKGKSGSRAIYCSERILKGMME